MREEAADTLATVEAEPVEATAQLKAKEFQVAPATASSIAFEVASAVPGRRSGLCFFRESSFP